LLQTLFFFLLKYTLTYGQVSFKNHLKLLRNTARHITMAGKRATSQWGWASQTWA